MTDIITQKSQLHELVTDSNLPETEKSILGQLIDDCSDIETAKKILEYLKVAAIKSADEYLEVLQKTKELFAIGQQMVNRRKENPEESIDDLVAQLESLRSFFE